MEQRVGTGRRALYIAVFFLTTLFATTSLAQESFTIVQLCDTQLGMGGYEHDVEMFKQAVVEINALAPDLVIICGDLVNDRKDPKSFTDFNSIRKGFEMPCYPAPGNHDVDNEPSAESLANYRKIIGKDYHTVEHKGYTFVITNTSLWKSPLDGESLAHDTWFHETLSKAKEQGRQIVVAGHYPPFVEDPEEKDAYFNLPVETRQRILDRCVETGVAAFLAGHIHMNRVHMYKGMHMVASGATSRNLDDSPLGFRLWELNGDGVVKQEFIELKDKKAATN